MSARALIRRLRWPGALGLLLLAPVVFWGWRTSQVHAIAVDALPPRPDLTARPAELLHRIEQAENEARRINHSVAGLTALSRLYHANGYYNEAIQCYAGLQQIEPGEARWPHLLANILAGSGRLEDALPLLRQAAALRPEYVPAQLRWADTLVKANRAKDARPVYLQVLARAAGDPYARLGLARCAIAENDWAGARDHLQTALQLHPDFSGAVMLLVTVHEHLGDVRAADALRAQGLKEFVDFPDPWIEDLVADCCDPYRLSVAAAVRIFSGDNTTAELLLRRAITYAPNLGTYRRQLGKLYFQQKQMAPARDLLEQAVQLNPADTEAWAILIDLLNVVGDGPALERALAIGLAHNPESAAMHYAQGNRLNRVGRSAEAIAAYTRARELKPDEVRPFVDLAMIYFRLDRIAEGVAELRGALVAEPGHPLPMGMLARHCIFTGDEAEASRWILQLRHVGRISATDLAAIVGEFRERFGHNPGSR